MCDLAKSLGIPDWGFRVIFGRTRIDYDFEKEMVNRIKHGYSLEGAVQLLERILHLSEDEFPCMTGDGFLKNGEVRHKHMCVDDSGRVVVVVTTMRPDEIVRVISYRRASYDERCRFSDLTGFTEA